jgi:hypothetical protein
MTKPLYIVVNPVASKFAKALQQALQAKVVNKIFRRNTPKTTRTIISRRGNVLRQGETLPHFNVTPRALNKIEQFHRFQAENVCCPKFALNEQDARQIDCKTLFARTLVNATNGRGIVEFESSSVQYPQAPLYTEYIPKKAEYRFHVFGGQVIDIQQKKKKAGFNEDERNTRIRNVNNGYVYCRDGVVAPDGAAALAVRAVEALGYSYGAVDLVYNEKRNQSYVLEVNSRPGLMGTTLDKYAEALINMFNLKRK